MIRNTSLRKRSVNWQKHFRRFVHHVKIEGGFPFLVVILLIMGFQSQCLAQADFGRWWNGLHSDTKLYWVLGFAQGVDIALDQTQQNVVKEMIKTYIDDREADVISRIMSDFYKDASNTYIPFKYMVGIAKMKLKGKPDQEIQTELETLRRYADYLRWFYDKQDNEGNQ